MTYANRGPRCARGSLICLLLFGSGTALVGAQRLIAATPSTSAAAAEMAIDLEAELQSACVGAGEGLVGGLEAAAADTSQLWLPSTEQCSGLASKEEEDITADEKQACRSSWASAADDHFKVHVAAAVGELRAAVRQRAQSFSDSFRPLAMTSASGAEERALSEKLQRNFSTRVAGALADVDVKPAVPAEGPQVAVKSEAVEAAKGFEASCSAIARQLARSAVGALALLESAEAGARNDLHKTSGFSQVVRCGWGTGQLSCEPGLRLSADDVSNIVVGSRSGERIKRVRVGTGEIVPGPLDFGASDTVRAQLNCPQATAPTKRLSCDDITYDEPVAQVIVAVHKPRWLSPTYRERYRGLGKAVDTLRSSDRRELSLVLDGGAPVILVEVWTEAGELQSDTVDVGYERWSVETGGFIAFSPLNDEVLVTKAGTGDKVIAVRARELKEYDSETGIYASFIPTNYKWFSLGLGFSTNSGNSAPSTYFGLGLRLQTFGHRGIASVMGGYALKPVDRFPEIDFGAAEADRTFGSDARQLKAEKELRGDWFLGISLGFSFGPIGRADESD